MAKKMYEALLLHRPKPFIIHDGMLAAAVIAAPVLKLCEVKLAR